MECERYRVDGGSAKQDRSFHRVTIDSSRTFLLYEQTNGARWHFPSPTRIPVVWSSNDSLRVVATWVARQGQGNELQGPVYVVDLDFSRLRLRVETFGGPIDFDQILSDPWRLECRRLN